MKTKTMAIVFLVGVLTALSMSAVGADLNVPYGSTENISGTQTYGQIIVNGTLNIADGANVTASRLMCGTNGTGTVVFNMGQNSKLTISGTDGNGLDCCFGYNTPCEASLAKGASIWSKCITLSYNGTGDSMLTLSNATVSTGDLFYFGRNSASSSVDPSRWTAQVRLTGADACLKVKNLTRNQRISSRVLFNGGYLATYSNYDAHFIRSNQNVSNSKLMLEGEDGNPIIIEANHSVPAYFYGAGSDTRVGTQGNCDLIFRGTKTIPLGSTSNPGAQSLTHTGRTIIQRGGLALNKDNILPKTTVIEVGNAATLDFAGYSQSVAGIVSEGTIVDSAGTAVLTLSGNSVESVLCEATSGLAGLHVDAGTARVRSSRRVGYKFYKFEPTARYGASANGTQYNEIYLFDPAGNNVTGTKVNYTWGAGDGISPELALDGNPATKYYSPGAVSRAWMTIEFAAKQPVLHYTFANGDDYGPIHKYTGRTDKVEPDNYDPATCRDVCAFDLKGSDDGENWRTIQSVPSFVPEDTRNYVYPQWEWPRDIAICNLCVGNGATLILDDVDLSVESISCNGSLVRTNDSNISVGGAGDGVVAHAGFSGSMELVKKGAGTTTMLGANSFSGMVDVQGGTLRFAEVGGGVGPYFKFVVTTNRNANDSIQFSELALYDAAGVRVNSNLTFKDKDKAATALDPGEITAIFTAGDTERPGKMTDGSTSTKCGLYTSTKPNPVTMRLADAYASSRVVSYALATANDHSERDPAGWYLESSTDGSSWTRLDTRIHETVGEARYSWAAYNGGQPYYATNLVSCGAAFSSSATVSVAADAVLDLSLSATEIGSLRVDCTGAGEIRGGAIADAGTIDIVGTPAQWKVITLPLTFSDVADCQKLSAWQVTVNGVPKPGCSLFFSDGHVTVQKPGMILLVM